MVIKLLCVYSLRIQPCLLAPRRQEERPRPTLGARDFSSAVSHRSWLRPTAEAVSRRTREKPLGTQGILDSATEIPY